MLPSCENNNTSECKILHKKGGCHENQRLMDPFQSHRKRKILHRLGEGWVVDHNFIGVYIFLALCCLHFHLNAVYSIWTEKIGYSNKTLA
jgi:hypothetical protein